MVHRHRRLGLLLILNGSMVASAAMVKEREAGTIEQLLMSPAGTYEIIIAKIAPLFLLLFLMVLFATALIKIRLRRAVSRQRPAAARRGRRCACCPASASARLSRRSAVGAAGAADQLFRESAADHASGALTPAEAMPDWLQPLVKINPIHHFSVIARSSMIKGSGFGTLWPNFLILSIFTVVMVSLSVWRFRKRLS